MQADHRVVLDQDVVGGGLRDAAGRESDDHDPSLECYALGRAVVDVATDRVEHDVGAAPFGDPLNLFYKVLSLVVDGVIGAQSQAHLDLLVRARGRDDPGAGGLAELYGRAPDTARS